MASPAGPAAAAAVPAEALAVTPRAGRPHLAVILPYLKPRGTEKQAVNLAIGLQRRGWRVSVIVVQGWGETSLYAQLQAAGAQVLNLLPPWRRAAKGASLRRLPSLLRSLRRLNCDLVLSRALLSHRVAGAAAWLLHRPFVAVYSAGIPDAPIAGPTRLARLRCLLWRCGLGWPQRLITVSAHSLEHLQRRDPSAPGWATAISNGVDTAWFKPVPRSPGPCLEIVSVTTLEWDRKGLDVLLQAFQQVQASTPLQLKLRIVGSGPDAAEIAAWVEAQHLKDKIELVGDQPDPRPWLHRADLFVLASRREGLPNALLEAMACGLCVLAANCPTGPAELIESGVNGWLVPVNDVDAFATAMGRLLGDPALRNRLGLAAVALARSRHSLDAMLDAYDHQLRQLLPQA
jgi:glycosyltransferase involved in cell wall biosynthesis